MRGPRRGGGLGVGQERGHLVGGGGRASRAAGPGDHPARFPRQLEAHDPGLDGVGLGGGAGPVAGADHDAATAAFTGEAEESGGQLPVEVLGVGDHLVALLAGQAPGGREVLVGVDEEAQQGRAPPRPVGLEDRELLRGRQLVGCQLDVEVERRLVDARRRFPSRDRRVDPAPPQWRFWRAHCSAPEDSVP